MVLGRIERRVLAAKSNPPCDSTATVTTCDGPDSVSNWSVLWASLRVGNAEGFYVFSTPRYVGVGHLEPSNGLVFRIDIFFRARFHPRGPRTKINPLACHRFLLRRRLSRQPRFRLLHRSLCRMNSRVGGRFRAFRIRVGEEDAIQRLPHQWLNLRV